MKRKLPAQDVIARMIYDAAVVKRSKRMNLSWQDIKDVFGDYEVKNWLVIRGGLQRALNNGQIKRTDDLHVEEYVIDR